MPDLDKILELLPSWSSRLELVKEVPGVGYATETMGSFVAPELHVEDSKEIEAGSTRLVIVSAPAAVGKSTLAEAIAAECSGILWDLGKFNLGDGSFAGVALKCFGDKLPAFLDEVRQGKGLVVMDALDEATVRAGEDNVEAFVRDLGKLLLEDEPARPPVVLLARTEAAELTSMLADDLNLPTAHYSIAYFDRDRAELFIDLRLDEDKSAQHRTHRKGFEEVRDLLFDRVFEVLEVGPGGWEEPEARAFLGYAPVLEALSEYLNQPNFSALKTELEATRDGAAQGQTIWRFLIDILEKILDREQRKLRESLSEALIAKLGPKVLERSYSGEEQCARLAAGALGQPLPDVPVPASLRSEYEDAAQQMLSEHPFSSTAIHFASTVFAEYVWAHTLRKGTSAHREAVRAQLSTTSHRASPLLARFMVEMANEAQDRHTISLPDFPIFYESIRAEDAPKKPVGLSVRETDGHLVAEVRSAAADKPLDLTIQGEEGATIEFLRRLSQADINVDDIGVRLGRGSEEFSIGPNVSIKAPEIVVGCRELRVEALQGEGEGVLIVTEGFRAEAPNPEVRLPQSTTLEIITATPLSYPWATHRSDQPEPQLDADSLGAALLDLGKLTSWFKSQGYGNLATHAKPVETAAAKGRLSQELLDFSKEKKLIWQDGKMLKLDPDAIQINFLHVKAGLLDSGTAEFLKEFVGRR